MAKRRIVGKVLKFAILLLVAAIIFVGWALGIIDFGELKDDASRTVSNAAGTAVRTMTDTPGASQNAVACAAACLNNMKRIESGKRALASKGMFATGTVSIDAIRKEIGTMPKCPCGGTYAMGTLEELPRCSLGALGTGDTKDDHILRRY